jgi:hypothetical protein
MEETTQSLLQRLLSRLHFKSYNPTKGEKKEKAPLVYFHQSNQYTHHVDKDNNPYVVRKGITYIKPLKE